MLALLLAILPACTTFYQATVPPAAGLDAIDHCLLTFALANRSADPEYAPVVAAEPDLVAIWDAFRAYARKPRRAIVFVRKRSDGWEIRFVPEKRDGSGVIEIYARGFARCMALHEPPVEVDLRRARGIRKARAERAVSGILSLKAPESRATIGGRPGEPA